MAKRIYFETIKKWALRAGIPAASAVTLLFLYLFFIGGIEITGHSGDSFCAGTVEDPCYAYINFTAKENIYIYPVGYDPWGRNTPFNFSEGLSSWKLQRRWGKYWRTIDLTKTWSIRTKYAVKFADGKDYQIRIIGYKTDPKQTIKWGFAKLDPYWYGLKVGYEFLEEGDILHIWNEVEDFYFATASGIQFTQVYPDYFTKNVFCGGWKTDTWHYTCTDAVNFDWNIKTDNITFINITGHKDTGFGNKTVRVGLRYHLKANDTELSVIPFIKNTGPNIPQDLGFAWKVKDIKVSGNKEHDVLFINDNKYLLSENLDLTFTDMTKEVMHFSNFTLPNGTNILINDYNHTIPIPFYKIEDSITLASVDLRWNENLNYWVKVKSTAEYNAPVTLLVNTGPLAVGQTKSTVLYWFDSPEGENLAPSGTGHAQFMNGSGSSQSYLLNDQDYTVDYWQSGEQNQNPIWFAIHWDTAVTSNKTAVISYINGAYNITDYVIEGSTDSTNGSDGTWTNLETVTANHKRNVTDHFTNSDAYNWYRWNVSKWNNGTSSGGGLALHEVEVFNYSSVAADTCTYTTGNWNVDCSDNCDITTVTDLGGNDLIFTGSGIFRVNANINNVGKISLSTNCKIIMGSGKKLG